MFGKIEDDNDSYFTSEQIALLMAVDPDFKDKYEKEQDLKNQIDYERLNEKSDKFDQRMPLDGSTANMIDLDYGSPDDVETRLFQRRESQDSAEGKGIRAPNAFGKGVCAPNGGALPLIPIAAKIVAPLAVKGIFKGIKWIIKKIKNKKKKKQEQKQQQQQQQQQTSGSGISAPNGGAIYNTVMDYIKKHNPQFNKFSNDLMRMKNKQAWRNILKYGKNITKDILKDYVNNDFDRSQLDKKIKRSFNKMIPYKFKKFIKGNVDNPNSFIERERRLNNFSLAKPVIKYGINEIAGSGPISKKAYKEAMKHLVNNYSYYGNGKLNWKKVGKIAKKGLSRALKFLKGFGDKYITGDNIKEKVIQLLNNFEVLKNLGINEEIGDISQNLIKKGYNKGYDTIQDKLDDDYSDVEDDIEKIKKGYSKAKDIAKGIVEKVNEEREKQKIFDNMKEGEASTKSSLGSSFGRDYTTTLDNGVTVGKYGFGKYSKNAKSPAVRYIIK